MGIEVKTFEDAVKVEVKFLKGLYICLCLFAA